ncbi:periplasmic chaperone LolA [gamma proteobacterium HTCC2207]|jgi:outer membrane lipoprotein carrier protein|uniref:Outer-membrane lipoprotein carrier protein n=1 Tax=gamma proteobacterium HTCC2207 TaxID=314287 RepID=Q1YTK5_9GAMM|nr:periplasmic chaperone LolA [gamma proteobacterium HTCC2207]MBT6594083.1 outer membrane lipoprotein chaperone LolA [Porticoccaceae bacterium]
MTSLASGQVIKKMMRSLHKIALPLFLLLTPFVSTASWSGGAPEDIQQLRDLLQPITSLSARFEQKISDAEGFELQASEGLFQVSQPNRLRWIVEAPMPQQIIADGLTLWVYDPDLEQVIIQPFNQDMAATPAILFSGDLDRLDDAYFVTQLAEGRFELKPEQGGSLFNSMTIAFDGSTPTSIRLTDTLGQTTTIRFSQLELNPVLSGDLFVFQAPDGVDVINNAN